MQSDALNSEIINIEPLITNLRALAFMQKLLMVIPLKKLKMPLILLEKIKENLQS